MKKISLLSLITSFAIIFTLQSCGGGNSGGGTPTADTTKPVIASDFSPAEGAEFTIGSSSIVIAANVSDNEALKSYTIDIHNNFDDHAGHTKAFEVSSNTRSIEYTPFAATKSGTISGKADTINETIEIKLYADDGKNYQTGKYHLVLTVRDAAGNETVTYRNIVLK